MTALSPFRIIEEPPRSGDRLFRIARVNALEDPEAGPGVERIGTTRAEVLELLGQLLGRVAAESGERPSLDRLREIDDVHFVNALCQAIEFGPLEKQQLLEADGIVARYHALRDLMRFRLAELNTLGEVGPDAIH